MELQGKIDKYFKECDKVQEPYTITRLGLALDMSRQDLINYSNKEEFFDLNRDLRTRFVENKFFYTLIIL